MDDSIVFSVSDVVEGAALLCEPFDGVRPLSGLAIVCRGGGRGRGWTKYRGTVAQARFVLSVIEGCPAATWSGFGGEYSEHRAVALAARKLREQIAACGDAGTPERREQCPYCWSLWSHGVFADDTCYLCRIEKEARS